MKVIGHERRRRPQVSAGHGLAQLPGRRRVLGDVGFDGTAGSRVPGSDAAGPFNSRNFPRDGSSPFSRRSDAVKLAEHRGRRKPHGIRQEDPRVPAAGMHRGENFAAPRAVRDSAHDAEGNVRAELAPKAHQVGARQAEAPQRVEGNEGARGVGGPSRHSSRHGYCFADRHLGA